MILGPHNLSLIDTRQPVNWDNSLNNGLLAWWKVLPQWFGGPTLRDLCGKHDGALMNMDPATDWLHVGPTPTGGALDFDAVNDYVDIGHPQDGQLDFTWCAWIKTTDTASNTKLWQMPNFIGTIQASGATNDALFGINNGKLAWYDELSGSSNHFTSTHIINDDVWHHMIATRGGAALTFFVDGVQVATSTTGTNSLNNNGMEIGRANWTSNEHWDGPLDDIRLYNRALSASEAMQLYAKSMLPAPDTLNYYTPASFAFVPAAPGGGRIMSSLVRAGGLAGTGGIAGKGGGLAG